MPIHAETDKHPCQVIPVLTWKICAAIMPLVLSASRGSRSPQMHSAAPPAKAARYY